MGLKKRGGGEKVGVLTKGNLSNPHFSLPNLGWLGEWLKKLLFWLLVKKLGRRNWSWNRSWTRRFNSRRIGKVENLEETDGGRGFEYDRRWSARGPRLCHTYAQPGDNDPKDLALKLTEQGHSEIVLPFGETDCTGEFACGWRCE